MREKVRKLEQDLKETNKRLQDITNQMDMLQKLAKKLTNPSSSGAKPSSSSCGRNKKNLRQNVLVSIRGGVEHKLLKVCVLL